MADFSNDDIGAVLAQQATLARRQALLDTLTKQNSNTPITGNTGLGQLFAHLATSYLNSKTGASLDAAQSANQGAYGNALSNAVSQYLQTREGMPAHPMSGPPTEDQANAGMGAMPGTAPAQPGDPRAALVQAISSRLPEMQMIGKGDLAAMAKGPKYSGTPVAGIGPDGKPVFFQPNELGGSPNVISGVSPTPDIMNVDGTVIDKRDPKKPLANYGSNYGPSLQTVGYDANGRPIQAAVDSTGKKAPAFPPGGGTSVSVSLDKGATPEMAGKVFEGARNQVLAAQTARQQAEQVLTLSKDPKVMQGFGANFQTGAAAIAAKMGWNSGEAVAKTQSLLSGLAKVTLEAAPNAHLSPMSDSDRAFLQQAVAGNLSNDPKAIQHIASLAWATAHNQELQARQQYQSAQTVEGAGKVAPLYPLPAFQAHKPPGAGFSDDPNTNMVQYNDTFGAPPAASAAPAGWTIQKQ